MLEEFQPPHVLLVVFDHVADQSNAVITAPLARTAEEDRRRLLADEIAVIEANLLVARREIVRDRGEPPAERVALALLEAIEEVGRELGEVDGCFVGEEALERAAEFRAEMVEFGLIDGLDVGVYRLGVHQIDERHRHVGESAIGIGPDQTALTTKSRHFPAGTSQASLPLTTRSVRSIGSPLSG